MKFGENSREKNIVKREERWGLIQRSFGIWPDVSVPGPALEN